MTPPASGTTKISRRVAELLQRTTDTKPKDGVRVDANQKMVPVSVLTPSNAQPRVRFGERTLQELADSIRQRGVLQPLLVRAAKQGQYEIVAGERRWRAAKMAGLTEVPVRQIQLNDRDALIAAVVENSLRDDLQPLEIARGALRLSMEFGLTQKQIGAYLGMSRPAVTNVVRLLGLPPSLHRHLEDGSLSAGHGRALLGAPEDLREDLGHRIVSEGWNVRRVEAEVRALQRSKRTEEWQNSPSEWTTKDTAEETRLEGIAARRGVRASLVRDKNGRGGSVVLSFKTRRELNKLIRLLGSDGEPKHG